MCRIHTSDFKLQEKVQESFDGSKKKQALNRILAVMKKFLKSTQKDQFIYPSQPKNIAQER